MPSQPNGAHDRNRRRNGASLAVEKSSVHATTCLAKLDSGPNGDTAMAVDMGLTGPILHSTLPALLSWGAVASLIFGGCCSNVFALEAIIKEEPESGLLITFVQFFVTFLFTLQTHVSASNRPWLLKPPAVPIVRWIPNILLFFTVNILNNFAFGYDISVPVHIILRSGGSVTTILVGFIWGKRFTRMQVFSVAVLTAGVIIAAMSDAKAKGKVSSPHTSTSLTSFLSGLTILFVAQVLSAIMGLYTQATYAIYGPHWNENLFYSHFLSLPLFLPFLPALWKQFGRLHGSTPLDFQPGTWLSSVLPSPFSPAFKLLTLPTSRIPSQVLKLLINSLTQYACIRGVNLLGARTSALGVTIVLNVRKLVSLFISIWLFGNESPLGVMVGAAVVFVGGGVYAWEGTRMQKRKAKSL
ncbi:golgi uridine diphosphate-N- acetylglucosamine transporter [Trapelia coarctata]|nr:golgi uridine diphosphate-N- acetylglucosamine transporter [Trapelia coarctata]